MKGLAGIIRDNNAEVRRRRRVKSGTDTILHFYTKAGGQLKPFAGRKLASEAFNSEG